MGSSANWKSNDCLCILSPPVAPTRLTEDMYLHRVKGFREEEQEEEEGSCKERKRKTKGERVMKIMEGHLRKTCRHYPIIRNLTTNDNSFGTVSGGMGRCWRERERERA